MSISDVHRPVREDVRLLGDLLGETLRRQEGAELFERVERVRAIAKARRTDPAADGAAGVEALAAELRAMPAGSVVPVARAFAHFLNLANVAEQHHRVRRRRAYQRDPRRRRSRRRSRRRCRAWPRRASSPDGAASRGVRAAASSWSSPRIRPRSCAARCSRSTNRIAEALAELDRPDLTPREREAAVEGLRREITAAWETEEVRRERPSPVEEVRSALTVFEQTLWDALPQYLRALDRALRQVTGRAAAARRGADSFRVVDRRRPRRQSERHAGRDANAPA